MDLRTFIILLHVVAVLLVVASVMRGIKASTACLLDAVLIAIATMAGFFMPGYIPVKVGIDLLIAMTFFLTAIVFTFLERRK
jgi:hypothetical protein